MSRLKRYLRPLLSFKFLLCFLLAWMITNGWSYVFILVGTLCDIGWMISTGAGWQAFLWMPFTPEKLVTIPLAMWFNNVIFRDAKTHKALSEMKEQAVSDWNKITKRRK